MTKEDKLIERKSAMLSKHVIESIESDVYTLDEFEDDLKAHWKQFQLPELQLRFLRAFWSKFEPMATKHVEECTNAYCGVNDFKDEVDVYLDQKIQKLAILTGEGFDPYQEEDEIYLFLRTAYLFAKNIDPGAPYSIMIPSDEIGDLLELPRPKIVKILTDLGGNGYVENVLGAKNFMLTQAGYEFLSELEKGKRHDGQLFDSKHQENPPYLPTDALTTTPPLPAGTRVKIFIIYSQKDQSFKVELEKHMKPLVRGNYVELFSDTQIEPGQDWNKEIRANLSTSHLILIFVSSDLFASDYSEEVEVKEAFARKGQGDSTLEIIPVLIRPCDWRIHAEISKLNLLPYNSVSVSQWVNQDEAYTSIIEGIKRVLTSLTGTRFPQ